MRRYSLSHDDTYATIDREIRNTHKGETLTVHFQFGTSEAQVRSCVEHYKEQGFDASFSWDERAGNYIYWLDINL